MRAAAICLSTGLIEARAHMHDDFVIAGDRLWKLLAARRLPELVHNGSIH